ncbi:MAG: tRNA A-37 threonylcarbamoyl transferase component Bud32 [Planctomycetaceae bacterium]|jgi:tRNA A-37 threonylcarbamoyl transferase component Bud32
MSRISAESFLSLIQQSGLVEGDRLQREVDDLEDKGLNVGEAQTLADSLIERDLLTEWQAEKLLRGKHKGFTLGKYRLRRLLGKGGMSSVYLAEHVLMRRQCAIKVLPIKRVEDTSYLARFHREARAVASLDHPNIVRAYDIDHETEGDRDIHFLVMEYVDGESLHDHVKESGPLTLDNTAEFFRQAALGLDNAHKNGLIHRDVKPGNLLIDRSEVVKVLDLGLARFSEVPDDNPLTLAHEEKVLGTADYLAPEQAMDSHTADHRADIYGLGCTAYFALTGYPPFREGTLTQRLMFHQTKEPPAISEERPEVGETKRGIELVKIVSQLMAKKPEERFQTMDEVATALARWLKIYATAEWRAAHPDAFLKSDAATSGGAVPVAKAVAVPVANAIIPEAHAPATTIANGGDTLLQTSVPDQPVIAPPVEPQPALPDANPVVTEAASAEPPSDNGADPGFGAFLAGFDGGAEAPTFVASEAVPAFEPVVDPPTEPVMAAPVEVEPEVAAVVEPEPIPSEPVAKIEDTVTGVPPAVPVASPAVPVASPVDAAPPVAAPVVIQPAPANEDVEPISVDPPPIAAPVVVVVTPPEAASTIAEIIPAEPAAPEAQPVDVQSVPSENAGLQGWDDEEPAAEPLADFDPSVLPAPISDEEEYPSLLGGTPTGTKIPGLDDPADATLSAMEQTQDYVPSGNTPTEIPSDATVVNPIEASSLANHDIVPAVPPAAAAPVEQFSFEPPQNDAPFFDPTAPAPPTFAEPVQPAAPVAQPEFGVEQPFAAQPQPAFPSDAPAFGAPSSPAQNTAAPGYAQPASAAKKKPPVAIIAGIVIALLAGGGAYFAFTGGGDDKPKSKKTASGDSKSSSKSKGSSAGKGKSKSPSGSGGKILGSSIKVGPGGDFSTIGAALDYLKKNKSRYDTGSRRASCKVEVIGGETYNEAIIVDNSGEAYPPGIQILSSGVGRAKLAPSGSGPAIRLVGIENFGIHGFDVDASGKDVAIEMSGYLNRTSLKDLNVTGFSKVGIAMKGAVGFSNDEITLEKIDLRGAGSTTAGIHLTSGENGTGRIKVLNCRLFGPQENGILFETDVTYVEMRENIIADAGVGMAFNGGPLTLKDVQILNTTFYKCSRGGIVISHMPPLGGGLAGSSGLAVHRNLFAQVNGPELLIENDFDDKKFDQFFSTAGGGVDQNWSDRQQAADIAAGQREIVHRENQRIQSIEFSSTDDSSPDFLTLKKSSPYARIGNPKLKTQPYVGAQPAK